MSDGIKFAYRVSTEIGALWKVLSQQAVGVLVRAALPRTLRVAKVDFQPAIDAKLCMLCHLGSLIPRERLSEFFRQLTHGLDNGLADSFGSMTSKRWAVLNPESALISFLTRQVQQHRKSRTAFNESADRRASEAKDEIAFPMTGHCPVGNFGRSVAYHDGVSDEGLVAHS
jgi:hypothetical protein